jgi:nucleoside diphosphate kinase
MQFAFALFSPDCVLSGKTCEALTFMSERGVLVLAHRWHRVSVDEVGKLYASNRSSRQATQFDEIVDELFGLSASLCCLLTSRQRLTGDALHRFLLDIKGPSDPFNCRPDQLRRALGATNKILNLVHTSDTPADSMREGALFFPEIHSLADHAQGVAPESVTYECRQQRVTLSGFRTLNEVKRRVLLSDDNSRGSGPLAHAVELERQLLESQADQVTLFPQLEEILGKQARAAATVESADLRALIYDLISVSARTTKPNKGKRAGAGALNRMLEDIGLDISRWESLVIDVEEAMAPRSLAAAQA